MRSYLCLFVLILSASAFAAIGGKWSLETHHGCKVWDDPPYDEHYTSEYKLWWSGTCSEGYASGDGYLQWGVPDKRYPSNPPLIFAQYDGTIVKGKLQGKGKLSLSNSYTYTGDFVDGQAEGQGAESWSAGDYFEGRYANGYRNGWGTYHFTNGDSIAGEWKDDKLQDGFQTYDWGASKNHYEGKVINNDPNGPGFLLDETGKHEGNWVNGKLTTDSHIYSVLPVQKNEKPSKPAP